tara:strand:+ start:129 stop:320 length:192 start_codon:yes stop_codon:yes gene_type:complete
MNKKAAAKRAAKRKKFESLPLEEMKKKRDKTVEVARRSKPSSITTPKAKKKVAKKKVAKKKAK